MAAERKTARELIESGLQETEKLLSQKNYRQAMVNARQTLEYIVKSRCKRNGIPSGDLMNMIDDLYRKGIISRETAGAYHKIRILGEKALRDGDNNAYNANSSYQLLGKEVYAYMSDAKQHKLGRVPSGSAGRRPARRRSSSFEPFDLLKILIPILAIILIIMVVRLVAGGHKNTEETTEAVTTTAAVETTEEVTTEAATETVTIYTTTKNLNVRTAPSTDADILTTLAAGTVVDFVRLTDDGQWACINYDNGEAYVSAQYLSASEAPAESESGASESAAASESGADSESDASDTAAGGQDAESESAA